MSAVHTLANATVVISGWAPSVSTLEDGNSVTVGGQWPFADNATVTVTKPTALALRVPCFSEVRKTQVLEPFLYQKTNDQFAKTGSGQTYGNSEKEAVSAGRNGNSWRRRADQSTPLRLLPRQGRCRRHSACGV